MRTRRIMVIGLLLALAAAGCGKAPPGGGVASAGGTPTPGASTGAGPVRDEDAPLKYSQCMREQGMTWFPDPEGDRLQIKVPPGTDKAKFDAAMAACKEFSPDGGDRGPADPELLEQGRKLSQCMRDNGVPNFPDPQPDGSMHVDGSKVGVGPGDPSFDQAEEACSKFMPERRETSKG